LRGEGRTIPGTRLRSVEFRVSSFQRHE
jgi:hypothetical protein